jgi:cytochrome c peroxidase
VDTKSGEGRRRKRIPMDGFRGNFVTSNPWEVGISADGDQFYVVFSGTDDMFVCETVDDDYREISLRGYLRLGRNPRAVRAAPDGKAFYVYNSLDFEVVAYDARELKRLSTIRVCENPLRPQVHRGKVLFHSALQPMVGRRWISCSSCHPDGEPDGRTWQKAEGLRDTPALAALAWTHPVLGPPNRGRSEDLDALAAYTNAHRASLSPYAKTGLSPSALRGREVFFSEETGCSTCHAGPFLTDSQPHPVDRIIRHNVGTGDADESEIMGPAYDTPTLLGIYRTAPYLHHGKARMLRDVLTTFNSDDRHGKTSQLSDQETTDLIAFLKSLPYEDPEPLAVQLGLTKISD